MLCLITDNGCTAIELLYIVYNKHYKIEVKVNCVTIIVIILNIVTMEKRLNQRIEKYITDFKDEIKSKIIELEFNNNSKVNELLEFVYDYERLVLAKDDFIKRKRIKNSIPVLNRCNAKRANGEQCTRRRKKDCEFCGTHSKGTPHGLMLGENEENTNAREKIEVFAQDIKGIVYYIDKYQNVYKTEDILLGKENPHIIAKCIKQGDNYTIPEFGLV